MSESHRFEPSPAGTGRWFRRGNTILMELADTGKLDFETAGGVPDKDYLHWVHGSLNLYLERKGRPERIAKPSMGLDSAEYRKAVKLFKSLAGVKPVNDKVDEKTQNALILANESNPKYLATLRTLLDKVGYAHLTIAYAKHEKPVAAIREFQKDSAGRFGITLKADGFVGAKTHLALLHAISALTPKRKPKPEVNWIEIVEGMPLAGLTSNPKERERLDCLKKFLLRALRGNPVDDRYKKVTDVGTYRFVEDFKRRCGTKRGTVLARTFKSMHNDVLAPINHVLGEIMRWRGDVTDGCICSKMQECEAGRFFLGKARQKSPESVYTCFRNVIEPGFKLCRKPCPPCV